MGTWLSSLFGGSSPGLTTSINTAQGLTSYGANSGEGNEGAASKYYQDILSGDPAKIAQSLAPALTANAQGEQEQKQTMGEFGSRSGGNTAAADALDSGARGNVVNLIGGALNGAASGAAGLGENEVSNATSNNAIAGSESETALHNILNSIFGQSISGAINYGESFLPIAHGG